MLRHLAALGGCVAAVTLTLDFLHVSRRSSDVPAVQYADNIKQRHRNMPAGGLWIGSHNIMDAHRLPYLLPTYAHLALATKPATAMLGVLCIQENVGHGSATAAHRVAAVLGNDFSVHTHPAAPRMATIYNTRLLDKTGETIVDLHRLEELDLFSRYFVSAVGHPEEKHGLVTFFRVKENGASVVVVNFHLDASGTNEHRKRQIESLALEIEKLENLSIVLCGDTNTFTWRASAAATAREDILSPLTRFGVDIAVPDTATHFFARANEPKISHTIAATIAKLGFDAPRCYDVIVSTAPILQRGYETTVDSDHDLVYAVLDVAQLPIIA